MKLKKFSEYFKCPSHPLAKKIGDALFLLGTLISGEQIWAGNNKVSMLVVGLTFVGKTFSNFFPDSSQTVNQDENG